jgi:hypothetical protein
LWTLPSRAQPTASTAALTGRVQNEATSQYLNNARVSVKGTDVTAFTDETGTFRLSGLPAGAVALEVFYSGLDPLQVTVEPSNGPSTASLVAGWVMVR